MRFLYRMFRRPPPLFTAPLEIPEPIAVIGDIHGCDQLLSRMLNKLAAQSISLRVICVGDYIDRGDGSAAVIDMLMQRPDIACLKGNHEAMCLSFLDNPETYGGHWLRHGGMETLASYDVRRPTPGLKHTLRHVRDDLASAMGKTRIDWLRELPLKWQTGNLLITHAGGDPVRAIDDQRPRDLLWGHPNFKTRVRADGHWLAFGHIIQSEPFAAEGRIAVDTGAYGTGVLTAAILGDGPPRFITS